MIEDLAPGPACPLDWTLTASSFRLHPRPMLDLLLLSEHHEWSEGLGGWGAHAPLWPRTPQGRVLRGLWASGRDRALAETPLGTMSR